MLCQLPFPTCLSLIDKAAGGKGRVESRLTHAPIPPPPRPLCQRAQYPDAGRWSLVLPLDGNGRLKFASRDKETQFEPRTEGLPEPPGPFLHNLPWSCQDPRPIPWAALKRDRTVVETRERKPLDRRFLLLDAWSLGTEMEHLPFLSSFPVLSNE